MIGHWMINRVLGKIVLSFVFQVSAKPVLSRNVGVGCAETRNLKLETHFSFRMPVFPLATSPPDKA
jgi:hypothetical protein